MKKFIVAATTVGALAFGGAAGAQDLGLVQLNANIHGNPVYQDGVGVADASTTARTTRPAGNCRDGTKKSPAVRGFSLEGDLT